MPTDVKHPMPLVRHWWMLTVRGVAAIVFGVLTFVAPGASLFALVVLFGAYALVNGAFAIGAAARGRAAERRWGAIVFDGIASMAFGALALAWPGITALALLYVIAAWAVVTGAAQIVTAIRLRKQIKGEWLLALGGALSIAFGVLLILAPVAGALAVTLWIGAYAVVFGAVQIWLSLRLRGWGRRTQRPLPTGGVPATA
jgi:uncharacterized membrane protein HdeD (DUF308 family)